MPQKINISIKGKSWKLELEPSILDGKSIGDKIDGKIVMPELEGYELEITGGSDLSGLPLSKDVEGIGLKGLLLTKGWGMHKRPKGERKRVPQSKGLRLRKTVRGRTISDKVIQINLVVAKEGSKKLEEIFPDQNKAPEPEKPAESPKAKEPEKSEKPQEAPKEEKDKTPTEEKPTTPEPQKKSQDNNSQEVKKEEPKVTEETKEEIAEEIAEEVKEEIEEDIPSSPETKTEEDKEEAAERKSRKTLKKLLRILLRMKRSLKRNLSK